MTDTARTPSPVVDAFIGALEDKDLERALVLAHDAIVYDNVPLGPVTGHDAVRTMLGPFLAGFDEVRWEVLQQTVGHAPDGAEVVLNERVDRFRRGERWVELRVAGVWVVRDGLITLWRDYFDGAALQALFTVGE